MSSPTISVIIPIYNSERFLRDCLTSVQQQTFKDIEIICVNDGSTDGSAAILDEFAKEAAIKLSNSSCSEQLAYT